MSRAVKSKARSADRAEPFAVAYLSFAALASGLLRNALTASSTL